MQAPGACLQVDGKGLTFDVSGRLKGQPTEVADIVLEVLHDALERKIITSRQLEDIVTEVIQGKERGAPGGGGLSRPAFSPESLFNWLHVGLPCPAAALTQQFLWHKWRHPFGWLLQALKEPLPRWAVCA